jgi:hypothetical protein
MMASQKGSVKIQKAEISVGRIEQKIYLIRGQRVILDADLAGLYGVKTKILNKAVKRNLLLPMPDPKPTLVRKITRPNEFFMILLL